MPTVRPARFRVTRVAGGRGYVFLKRLGGRQRADRAIDMRADMTRSTEGGSETPCYGYEPYPTEHCGTRSWALDGRPGVGRGHFLVGPEVPPFPSIQKVMEDDNQGRAKSPYWARISVKRLFRPGRRTLHLHDSYSFTSGSPNQFGGGFTEVRTVDVTIRKLR